MPPRLRGINHGWTFPLLRRFSFGSQRFIKVDGTFA
jgi:hypothetical protein